MAKPTDDGSVPLPDIKREKFAMGLAGAMDYLDAYERAGYSPDRKNARRMAERDDVKARVRFLMAPALRTAGISRERVMKEIAALAFSDIRQVVKWGSIQAEGKKDDETGIPAVVHFNDVAFINSDQLTDEAAAAIAEVKRSAEGAISIKLHSKIPALKMLSEILRMTAPADPDKPVGQQGQGNLTLIQQVFNVTAQQASDDVAAAFKRARADAIDGTAADDA